MRRDPRRAGWLVAAASVAAVGAFMLGGFYFWQNDRPHFSLWVDVFWTIAAPVTAIRALLTARRQSAAQLRFAWNCFAAGCTCFALGMLVWDWFEPVEGRFRPFPTIADLGYLLVSLWYMAGFVAFRPSAPS